MEMRYREIQNGEKGLSAFLAKSCACHAENARNMEKGFQPSDFSLAQKLFNVKHMKRVIKGVTGKQ